jgi:hypothetical protein
MLATDPARPIAPGWSRVTVQFPGGQSVLDFESARLDEHLAAFEKRHADIGLEGLRCTLQGGMVVRMIADKAMKDAAHEVLCTAGLWVFLYSSSAREAQRCRQFLDLLSAADGGAWITCTVDADLRWSFTASWISST